MMIIADQNTDSHNGKKLEKSLDAVAALRRAMEERLAAHKAAHSAAPQEQPVQESATQESAVSAATDEVSGNQAPEVVASASIEAESAASKVAPETPAAAEGSPTPKAEAEEKPMTMDPIEWAQILFHVAEGCQRLIVEFVQRMRMKQPDQMAFSATPVIESMTELSKRFLSDPDAYTEAQLALWQNYLDITRSTLLRMQGMKIPADAQIFDKRFQSKDWQNNWMFDFLKQSYLMSADEARKLVQKEAAQIDSKLAKKIEFYTKLFLDATAPSNFWLTNPVVLRATLESRGNNLIKGFENLLQDLESGNGTLRIRMSDYHAFEIGKNIAVTPGKVVYQNDLMQLIQYSPSTDTVRRVPLLIIPPWINKYYILDLRETNSYIRYLVAQGFTVFCISWVNPTKRHALTQFEDYMDKGALIAMREVKRMTGEDEVNTVGYCIGGTLLACAQAYLAASPVPHTDLPKIASATYLVTMIDFANPGDLGVFIDEDQIRVLEDRMARQGFLDAASMMLTFNLLRANDLIWPFVINNYLLGREPFPFDILYWNTDSTNLPAAMQSYYLRKMYLDNKLIAPNALKMRGVPLDLYAITTPTFMLSTKDDHIAPWRSTYAATQIYQGPVKFVLSQSGHIAGVINPPSAEKYGYWTNDACPEDPEEWVVNSIAHKGSWWPEWIKWLDAYAGESITARTVPDGLEAAPGSYVKVRAV
jgi:polyhydroxyalkanoate synthase